MNQGGEEEGFEAGSTPHIVLVHVQWWGRRNDFQRWENLYWATIVTSERGMMTASMVLVCRQHLYTVVDGTASRAKYEPAKGSFGESEYKG